MDTKAAIRVLLVDDHAVYRRTLGSQLARYRDLEVIGEARDGAEAAEIVGRLHPAVVLMDVHLARTMDGIAATRLLMSQYPGIAVLGLSWDVREYVVSAMHQAGAIGVLDKDQTADGVHTAILRAVTSMSNA